MDPKMFFAIFVSSGAVINMFILYYIIYVFDVEKYIEEYDLKDLERLKELREEIRELAARAPIFASLILALFSVMASWFGVLYLLKDLIKYFLKAKTNK